jgi:cell division protein FtsL
MYRLKDQKSAPKSVAPRPIQAAKRRRQLYPFLFHMGPVTLCVCSVLLIGLMALLYLSQLNQAVTANNKLLTLHAQEAVLQRQNQDLVNTVAQEQSPAYISAQAKRMGLVLADPNAVQVLVVPHLKPAASHNQIQPIKP